MRKVQAMSRSTDSLRERASQAAPDREGAQALRTRSGHHEPLRLITLSVAARLSLAGRFFLAARSFPKRRFRLAARCVFPAGLLIAAALFPITCLPAGRHAKPESDVVSKHDAAEWRRSRIADLRWQHLQDPSQVSTVLELADAYRDAGMIWNALRELEAADALLSRPAQSDSEAADHAMPLIVAWGHLLVDMAAPDSPHLIKREHFEHLYHAAAAADSNSSERAALLLTLARLHRLVRKTERDSSWWSGILVDMQRVHPDLPLRDTWQREPNDSQLHLVSALHATRAVLRVDSANAEALCLNAALNLDLGKPEEALASFRRAFDLMTPRELDVHFSCDFIASADQRAQLKDAGARAAYWQNFWLARAPAPGSLLSDALLEYWKRVALARLDYGPVEQWIDNPGHPATVLVRFGEPDSIRMEPMRSTIDASLNVDLSRTGAFWVGHMTRKEIRPGSTLTYAQAGRSYCLKPASAEVVQQLSPSTPLHVAGLSGARLPFYSDWATIPRRRSDVRTHVSFALPPPGGEVAWWEGATVRTEIVDASEMVVEPTREHRVHAEDIVRTPEGPMLLGAQTVDGLATGTYVMHVQVLSEDGEVSYQVPFASAGADAACLQDSLAVGDLEFAYDQAPGKRQPQFERSGWHYAPNPARLIDCRDPAGCVLNIVYEVSNVAHEKDGTAVLVTDVFIVPEEYVLYKAHLAAAAQHGVTPMKCGDLDPKFRQRAACDEGSGVQHESLLTDGTYLVVHTGPLEPEMPDTTWGRVRIREIVPLRQADRYGRALIPQRIDVSGLEAGRYVVYVRVHDRLAEKSAGHPVSAIGYRKAPFRIVKDDPVNDQR